MPDTSEIVVEQRSPEDAFELMAHEIRLGILESLNAADQPLAFGELRQRVGTEDPGRFNYHLGKLADRFVEEREQGYELTGPGRRVVGGILSGGYTKTLDADPVAVDGSCSECGSPLEAQFHTNGVRIVCQACEFAFTDPQIPAGALEGISRESVSTIVDRWLKQVHAAADYGFCYNCDGRLNRKVVLPSDETAPDWLIESELAATALYDCERCGMGWQSILPYAILNHPAVVAFHYKHGIDLRKTPHWNLEWPTGGLARTVNESPTRVDVPIALEDETRIFTIDRDLDVIHQRVD